MTLKTKMIIAGIIVLAVVLLGLYAYLSLPSVQQRIRHVESRAIEMV
ncbi:MAG: hypothetical protein WCJ75_11375 [Desulfomonile sp.]|jgi:hypothetical protein